VQNLLKQGQESCLQKKIKRLIQVLQEEKELVVEEQISHA
jgi:hypothetical protein